MVMWPMGRCARWGRSRLRPWVSRSSSAPSVRDGRSFGQPLTPVAGKRRVGRQRRDVDEAGAGGAGGGVGLIAAARAHPPVRSWDGHAPTHALPGRVRTDAACLGIGGQLPFERFDARDQPPELAGELDRASTACSRLRVALLLVEGARRRLLGETPGALPAIVVPAHDPTLAARIELDAHDTTLVGQPMSAPPPIGLCHENLPPPSRHKRPTRRKSPANAGLSRMRRRGLEPPPSNPGPGPQPCNPGVRSVQIVRRCPERPRIWT